MLNRREILKFGAAAASVACAPSAFGQSPSRAPQILLRSSWQSVNIGDVGHTPGALQILESHFPEAEITLWPGELGNGAREFLTRAFPRLKFATGSIKDGLPTTKELKEAWDRADLYLSGSGSGFPASEHAIAFRKATGKPVGVFGVSTDPVSGFGKGKRPEGGTLNELRALAKELPSDHLSEGLRYVMNQSAFFFCRDTISRDYLKAQGVKSPILEFGPDAQLGMHLRDDERGEAYLDKSGLEAGKFICVIPRLRYTPYYRIRKNAVRTPDDDVKDAINDRTTEKDHAKLRDMIVRYVRKTGCKVLACPEMTYQIELAKTAIVEPLPGDVKDKVVWRDTYWMPDEAASVYARATAVISLECHSPLISLHNGTPTFYIRQPTDTCKGQMYRDIGANDWFFEVDETNGEQLWQRLETILEKPQAARDQVSKIMAGVSKQQQHMALSAKTACTKV